MSVDFFNVLRIVLMSASSCLFCTAVVEITETTTRIEAKRTKTERKRGKSIVADQMTGDFYSE